MSFLGALKRKLNDQTSELREYKERVRDLQDQLIKVHTAYPGAGSRISQTGGEGGSNSEMGSQSYYFRQFSRKTA